MSTYEYEDEEKARAWFDATTPDREAFRAFDAIRHEAARLCGEALVSDDGWELATKLNNATDRMEQAGSGRFCLDSGVRFVPGSSCVHTGRAGGESCRVKINVSIAMCLWLACVSWQLRQQLRGLRCLRTSRLGLPCS